MTQLELSKVVVVEREVLGVKMGVLSDVTPADLARIEGMVAEDLAWARGKNPKPKAPRAPRRRR